MNTRLAALRIKIYADGADLDAMKLLNDDPLIAGFTTNPTLMRKAGITDYERYCKTVLDAIQHKPVSFEVFADDYNEMYRQAKIVSTWGKNVYVKIPIINTRKVSMAPLIVKLVAESIPVNVTAVLSRAQMSAAKEAILFGMNHGGGAVNGMPHIISVFAGRLADIGCLELCALTKSDRACVWQGIQWLWASPREIYNIFNAEEFGYNIITIGHDLLKKIPLIGKDPDKYSLETVRMFYNDAKACGFKL